MSAADGEPRPLTEADVKTASLTVARAFAWHEPWGAWALPDEATREQRLQEMVAGDIRERFLPLGRCSTIDGLCVSLWCPPSSHPNAAAFGPRRDDDAYELFGERLQALRAADALLQTLIPAGEHWYLDTLATEPARMGEGLGGRLLDHDLAALDTAGQFAALDTHTPANVGFYERRGFEVVASSEVPHGGPPLFVMLRTPRPA
jgi:ribosomal protein S18 acetylase RimI-like enzyme